METTYAGKVHEKSECGEEECVGSFSGSNVFRNHNQNGKGSWYIFSQRCKELIGGLMLMISNAVDHGCDHMIVDLDLQSRIVKPGQSCCEPTPIVTEVIPTVTTEIAEPTEMEVVTTPVVVTKQEPIAVQEVPVRVPVQEVPLRVPVQEVPIRVPVQQVPVAVQSVPVTIQPPRTEIVKEIEIPIEEEYEDSHKHHHHHEHDHHHHEHHDHHEHDYYPQHRHVKEYIREVRGGRRY